MTKHDTEQCYKNISLSVEILLFQIIIFIKYILTHPREGRKSDWSIDTC